MIADGRRVRARALRRCAPPTPPAHQTGAEVRRRPARAPVIDTGRVATARHLAHPRAAAGAPQHGSRYGDATFGAGSGAATGARLDAAFRMAADVRLGPLRAGPACPPVPLRAEQSRGHLPAARPCLPAGTKQQRRRPNRGGGALMPPWVCRFYLPGTSPASRSPGPSWRRPPS